MQDLIDRTERKSSNGQQQTTNHLNLYLSSDYTCSRRQIFGMYHTPCPGEELRSGAFPEEKRRPKDCLWADL